MRTLSTELGKLAENWSHATRIYADANVPAGVVSFMRHRLGWDVFFVMEHDEVRRAPDIEHYRLARQYHRTLLTLDHDYLDDRRFPPAEGGGVIVLSAPDERGISKLLARLDQALFRIGGAPAAPDSGSGRPMLPLEGRKLLAHPDWHPESAGLP